MSLLPSLYFLPPSSPLRQLINIDLGVQGLLSQPRVQQKLAALRQKNVSSLVSAVKETNARYHDLRSQAEALLQSVHTQRVAQDPPLPPVKRHMAVKMCKVKDEMTRDILGLAISVDLRPGHGFEGALDASVAGGLNMDRLIGEVLFLDDCIQVVQWWLAAINGRRWRDDGSWDLGLHGSLEEQADMVLQQLESSSAG